MKLDRAGPTVPALVCPATHRNKVGVIFRSGGRGCRFGQRGPGTGSDFEYVQQTEAAAEEDHRSDEAWVAADRHGRNSIGAR